MPSSLTMVLPIASVCSTRPPVSVLVRAPAGLPRGFSREHGVGGFTQSLRRRASPCLQPGFASAAGRTLSRGRPEPRPLILLRRPIGRVASRRRCRNVRLLCIGYAFRPRLSSRLTLGGLASPRKPWTYGGRVSRPALVTHASILTPGRSTEGRPSASPRTGSSPTTGTNVPVRRFGAMLSPVYCRRMSTRPVSYYALFEWVAASKPTSWLSGRTHILCHSTSTWGP